MNRLKVFASMTLAAVLATGMFAQTPAPAPEHKEGKHGRHHGARRGGFNRMAQALNLTDAQKQQAQELHRKQSEATRDLRAQMHELRKQTAEARQANDTAKLETLKQQRQELMPRLRAAMESHHAEFRALLTPEQQTRFDRLKSEFKNKRDKK